MAPGMDDLAGVRAALLAWYHAARRTLPWRETRDPYAIWISEVMLQQTRVETVIPYWTRFVERWPDVRALAAARPEDVRAAWSGLGYYRRAELMLRAAHAVVERHDGALPADVDALRALPGFGAYTAGAVASIAFERPVAAVDGNVERVLARLAALEGAPRAVRADIDALAARLAAAVAPDERPSAWTQALMELGATVCTPRSPSCARCPLAAACRARATDRVAHIPPPRVRAARKRVELDVVVVGRDDGAIALVERPVGGLFGGLFTPLLVEAFEGTLAAHVEATYGLRLDALEARGELTHVLTHRDLVARVHVGTATRARRHEAEPLRWVRPDALDALGVPSFTVRLLRHARPELARAPLPGRRTRSKAARREDEGQLTLGLAAAAPSVKVQPKPKARQKKRT